MDDPDDDQLKEIEAYLSGEAKPAPDEPVSVGFDEMLKSALSSATMAAPVVEENDAWLDAILAETEEQSLAAVDALYGNPDATQTPPELSLKPAPKVPEEQPPSDGDDRLESPGTQRAPQGAEVESPGTQRAPQGAENSLEDAVAAALRSVAMPAVAAGSSAKKRPAPSRRDGRMGSATRRMGAPGGFPPAPPAPRGEPAAVPARAPEVAESAKVKELREQVQQFGRETERYRDRMEEQAKQARTKGRRDVFDRLLPILDTLDIAIQSAPEAKNVDKVIAGVEMVFSQLLSELSRLGLESINPVGETFDPALHEAMQKSDTGTVDAGKINKVLRRGFLMNDKLVRAAQVIVEL